MLGYSNIGFLKSKQILYELIICSSTMDMSQICRTCHECPSSHSFSKLCEQNNISIFYTNPGEAEKYSDRTGIIAHMDNMLSQHVSHKWAWIFDGAGFQHHHMMELQLTRDIITLINDKYNSTLVYVHVKNTNPMIKQLFGIISPFMVNSDLASKIKFD